MSVTIRLRRIGRKKQPYYRVVVTDSRNAGSGAYLETLGHYTSISKPAELRLDLDRLEDWVARGATMSETVRSLVSKARKGGDAAVAFKPAAAAAAAAPVPEPLAAAATVPEPPAAPAPAPVASAPEPPASEPLAPEPLASEPPTPEPLASEPLAPTDAADAKPPE